MKERRLTDDEQVLENFLIMLLMDEEFPEPKDACFELREYDDSIKTLFLWVDDKFTEEQSLYIKRALRPVFNRKLIVGTIKKKSLNNDFI